jgi:hypothetical protein
MHLWFGIAYLALLGVGLFAVFEGARRRLRRR